MNKEQCTILAKRSDAIYWSLLRNLSEIKQSEENGLKWLSWPSGKLDWIYDVNTNDVDYVINRMKKNEIPKNLYFPVGDTNIDPLKTYIESNAFKITNHGTFMAHELSNIIIRKPDNEINILRVTEYWQLKIAAMIESGEEELFTFRNYEEIMATKDTYFYLAEYKGFPASCCMAQFGDDFVNITWISTLSQFRNRGIAGYLIQAVERDGIAASKKYGTLCACHSDKAFIKVGYREYGKVLNLLYKTEEND